MKEIVGEKRKAAGVASQRKSQRGDLEDEEESAVGMWVAVRLENPHEGYIGSEIGRIEG